MMKLRDLLEWHWKVWKAAGWLKQRKKKIKNNCQNKKVIKKKLRKFKNLRLLKLKSQWLSKILRIEHWVHLLRVINLPPQLKRPNLTAKSPLKRRNRKRPMCRKRLMEIQRLPHPLKNATIKMKEKKMKKIRKMIKMTKKNKKQLNRKNSHKRRSFLESNQLHPLLQMIMTMK